MYSFGKTTRCKLTTMVQKRYKLGCIIQVITPTYPQEPTTDTIFTSLVKLPSCLGKIMYNTNISYGYLREYIVITDRRTKVGFDTICNTNTTAVGLYTYTYTVYKIPCYRIFYSFVKIVSLLYIRIYIISTCLQRFLKITKYFDLSIMCIQIQIYDKFGYTVQFI